MTAPKPLGCPLCGVKPEPYENRMGDPWWKHPLTDCLFRDARIPEARIAAWNKRVTP